VKGYLLLFGSGVLTPTSSILTLRPACRLLRAPSIRASCATSDDWLDYRLENADRLRVRVGFGFAKKPREAILDFG
jgi:hypothetical protein